MVFTEELVLYLISCPKRITDGPKSSSTRLSSSNIKFMLESLDGVYNFSGFISKNTNFQENYSVGLVFKPKDEKANIVLLRVNGPHGLNEFAPHHDGPHVHIASAQRINEGLKPEGNIETNVPYTTVDDAIQYYMKRIGVLEHDRIKHFPIPNVSQQIDLDFNNSESEVDNG